MRSSEERSPSQLRIKKCWVRKDTVRKRIVRDSTSMGMTL